MMKKDMNGRIETATGKFTELMNIILSARCGDVMEFDHVQKLIQDIYKDEIELISIIADMEFEKRSKTETRELDIPEFMNKDKKGA